MLSPFFTFLLVWNAFFLGIMFGRDGATSYFWLIAGACSFAFLLNMWGCSPNKKEPMS